MFGARRLVHFVERSISDLFAVAGGKEVETTGAKSKTFESAM